MHTISDKKLLMLKPDSIHPSSSQPRKSFDEYELKSLADSIQASGIIQPLTVRKNSNGEYELIAGERRLRAAKMAGLRRVPCVLHKTDDATAAFYSVIENLQRSSLTFFEEAYAIERLTSDFGLSQAEISSRLGMAQSTLSNKLRILKLSEDIKERIVSAGLTERHARALLKIPPEKRSDILDKIIAEGLNLKQTEELIDAALKPEAESPEQPCEPTFTPVRKAAIGDVRLFANSLSKLLCTLQNAGIDAHSKKHETEKYIEYRVRISKNAPEKYKQLKIC